MLTTIGCTTWRRKSIATLNVYLGEANGQDIIEEAWLHMAKQIEDQQGKVGRHRKRKEKHGGAELEAYDPSCPAG